MAEVETRKLIDGKAAAEELFSEVTAGVERFSARHRPPNISVIIVGEDPASKVYVKSKVKAAGRCGIDSRLIEHASDLTEDGLLSEIDRLNSDTRVDGILVQLPLPPHIDKQRVIERISPDKDVDGLHPYNIGRLASDLPRFVPCTPAGIMRLLGRYNVETAGKRVVIVGRSILVGKPLALLLVRKGSEGNATVTICHSRTGELSLVTKTADILVAAIGRAEMITGDMVKEGAVVIDVGVNRVDDPEMKRGYRLRGDVEFESAGAKASLITPVPGGVGPMTVAMLMSNTLMAAKWAKGVEDDGKQLG